jgi:hypothetical protein
MRATVRMRHADAGVVSEMARSLHRNARSERERVVCRAHRSRSSARLILPLEVFGSSSAKSTIRGYL